MTDQNTFDPELIGQLAALNAFQQGEFTEDDDDDEGIDWEFAEDDDDDEDFDADFVEDDDDDESYLFGDEDDDDEDFESFDGDMAERRRRRRRRRSFRRRAYRRGRRRPRLRRIRGSKSTVLRARNGQRMQVQFGKRYATSAEVNKLIKSTEARFRDALKERKLNYDRLSKQIASATSKLDSRVASVSKSVKSLESRSQTQSLLGLLMGQPKIKSIKFKRPDNASQTGDLKPDESLEADVEYKKDNMLLPLLLGGGLGGSGGDANQGLLLALAFQNND